MQKRDPEANILPQTLATQPKRKIPITKLRIKDTHRLIASKYSETGTVLSRLSSNASTLSHLLELDDATNDRLRGEEGLLPGIGIHELVYGIRYAHIVNAAFTHASPSGGRFNSPTRGAWYASLDRATSTEEIAFHKVRALDEIDWPHEEVFTSDDYLADITSSFHDLRDSPSDFSNMGELYLESGSHTPASPAPDAELQSRSSGMPLSLASSMPAGASGLVTQIHTSVNPFARYLQPVPIPYCYARSQRLADRLLSRKSNGIIYPSVRRLGGVCVVSFRPALVYNVRRGARLEFRLQRGSDFRTSEVREISTPA